LPTRNLVEDCQAFDVALGVVTDGLSGTLARIESAKRHAPDFGIASACGISRGRNPNMALDFIKT